jgi:hypothetical protein
MEARPKLAVLVARIATGWSRVEQSFGFLAVQLLGAHAHTGMKMYKALSGAAAQRAVLRAVARDRLPTELVDELEALLRLTKRVGSKRNGVVHGIWEVSDQMPEALIWCDSADSLLSASEFWAGWLSRDKSQRLQWASREYNGKGPPYLVYERPDFESILDEINVLQARLMSFTNSCMKLRETHGNDPG